MDQAHEPQSVGEVLDELDHLAEGTDKVCISDVLDDFGGRSFGPFLMLFALLELSPVGAIPGIPTFLALCILLISGQLALGKEHVWLPGFIQSRSVESRKLEKAVEKLRGMADWLDEHSKDRLDFLTAGVWMRVAGAVAALLCLTVPPLEVVPFASSLPMLAIAIIGLSLTVKDGALMLGALVFAGIASGIAGYLYTTSSESGGFLPF